MSSSFPLDFNRASHPKSPTGHVIYLNAGTLSICPSRVSTAVEKERKRVEENPTAAYFDYWHQLWGVQTKLAAFLGAHPKDLVLAPNVSFALNQVLLGLEIENGEILVNDWEYGAIVSVCRLKAETEGHSVRSFSLPKPETWTQDSLFETVVSAIKPETKLLLLSHVFSSNLSMLPIERIARVAREEGIVLVVDGAHGPGALPLQFQNFADVDVYAGNLHKWVMGPKGTAFAWVHPRLQSRIRPTMGGWTTYGTSPRYQDFERASPWALRLVMSSCFDFTPFFGLNETFDYWMRRGPEAIRKRQRELAEKLYSRLTALSHLRSATPVDSATRVSGSTFVLPEKFNGAGPRFCQDLYARTGLQVTSFEGFSGTTCLRVSPHVHNSDEDVERALEILSRETSP